MSGGEIDPEIDRHLVRHYMRQVARIADSLRRMADRLDNESRRTDDVLRDAHDIEHELRWGHANLPVDALLAAAREVVSYRAAP